MGWLIEKGEQVVGKIYYLRFNCTMAGNRPISCRG